MPQSARRPRFTAADIAPPPRPRFSAADIADPEPDAVARAPAAARFRAADIAPLRFSRRDLAPAVATPPPAFATAGMLRPSTAQDTIIEGPGPRTRGQTIRAAGDGVPLDGRLPQLARAVARGVAGIPEFAAEGAVAAARIIPPSMPGVATPGAAVKALIPLAQAVSRGARAVRESAALAPTPAAQAIAQRDPIDDVAVLTEPDWWIENAGEGLGSQLAFFLPAAAIQKLTQAPAALAKGASLVARAKRLVVASRGVAAGAAFEAFVEAGGQHRDALDKGVDADRAAELAASAFAQQFGLLMASAVPGYVLPASKRLATRLTAGAVGEATQESGQTVIGNRLAREYDPSRPWSQGVATAGIVAGPLGAAGAVGLRQQAPPPTPIEAQREPGRRGAYSLDDIQETPAAVASPAPETVPLPSSAETPAGRPAAAGDVVDLTPPKAKRETEKDATSQAYLAHPLKYNPLDLYNKATFNEPMTDDEQQWYSSLQVSRQEDKEKWEREWGAKHDAMREKEGLPPRVIPAQKPAAEMSDDDLTAKPSLGVRIEGITDIQAVDSWEAAGQMIDALRDRLESEGAGGASQFPDISIVDARTGKTIGRGSYNGRLWDAETGVEIERNDGRGYGKAPAIEAAPPSRAAEMSDEEITAAIMARLEQEAAPIQTQPQESPAGFQAPVRQSGADLGRAAFAKGQKRIAPRGVIANGHAEAWYQGWDEANVGAPVPGWTAEENAARPSAQATQSRDAMLAQLAPFGESISFMLDRADVDLAELARRPKEADALLEQLAAYDTAWRGMESGSPAEAVQGVHIEKYIRALAARLREPIQVGAGRTTAAAEGPQITYNSRLQSVEIAFPSKPAADVLAGLKKAGYRWAKTNKVWYRRQGSLPEAQAVAEARGIVGIGPTMIPGMTEVAVSPDVRVRQEMEARTTEELTAIAYGTDKRATTREQRIALEVRNDRLPDAPKPDKARLIPTRTEGGGVRYVTEPVQAPPSKEEFTTGQQTRRPIPLTTRWSEARNQAAVRKIDISRAENIDEAEAMLAAVPVPAKAADLDARKAANKAKRDALAAELAKELGTTLNVGADPKHIKLMVGIMRTYIDDGVVEFERAWRMFKEEYAVLAAKTERAFELAWEMLRGETRTVDSLQEEAHTPDQDVQGNRPGRDPASELPERGGVTAQPSGTGREGPLGAVRPESGQGAQGAGGRAGVRDSGPGGVVVPGVSDDARAGTEPGTAFDPSGGTVSGGALATSGDAADPGVPPGDYQLTPARIAAIISRPAGVRLRDNVAAIRMVKTILVEQRHPTSAEQEALAKYVGWGDNALAQFLADEPKYDWSGPQKAIWRDLQSVLTENERASLIRSSPNAHFTFDLYAPIWSALEAAGFHGGRVLEPAVGTGHAFGFMSPAVRQQSTLTAVELDAFTALIAQALYPSAKVQVSGYEKARIPRGTQDLVISNVPFGDFGVEDNRFPKFITDRIHNYFFARALEHVRPGGFVVFVTSRYTMDGPQGARVRQYLMERAHFVGAVRLPNTAFDKTAKTEVVTDLIVLQRMEDGETGAARNAKAFIESPKVEAFSGEVTQGWGRNAKRVQRNVYRSSWYTDHPELLLGTESLEGTMRAGGEYTVTATTADLQDAIRTALRTILPEGAYRPATSQATTEAPTLAEGRFTVGEYRIGPQGQILRVSDQDGALVDATPKGKTAAARIRGMVGIRDYLRAVVAAMRTDQSDAEIRTAQKRLSKAYKDFVSKHGILNALENRRTFQTDPDATNLLGLEHVHIVATEKLVKGTRTIAGEVTVKALSDIFTKRTIHAVAEIDRAETPRDALLASLSSRAVIDWDYIARISGQTAEAQQTALLAEGLVFEQPDGTWALRDEYLSGDVKTKLADAEAADPATFARNVEALRAVQPTEKTVADTQIAFGAHWVPQDVREAFVAEQLGLDADDVTIRHDQTLTYSRWTLNYRGQSQGRAQAHPLAVPYGPDHGGQKPYVYTFTELVDDALNLRLPDLKWTEGSGDKKHTVRDPRGTEAARANLDELDRQWQTWVYSNAARTDRLLTIYNERMNRTVPRVFDGSHLANVTAWNPETKTGTRTRALPGLALPFPLHPHQLRGIWRAIVSGNTLLAHDVGAGKTFEMIVIAMEMRRLGRARKPMITVPTYLLGQWREDIVKAYPQAKILAFTEEDLGAEKRQAAMARIAFGDWDIVLVPHSSFQLLSVSDARMASMLQQILDEIVAAEAEAIDRDGADHPSVKQLARRRRQIEDKLNEKLDKIKKAGSSKNLTWEDLGVDALIVDEAQSFKNLYFHTNINGLRGLSNSEADKSLDLYVKVQDINEASHYRNLIFATATPVMNSLAEAFTMQRYLQPQRLRDAGLHHFDNWYAAFAKVASAPEQLPDGSYREVRRLQDFKNLKTLHQMFAEVMDYVSMADMPYLKLPTLEGGKVTVINTDPHPAYDIIKNWFTRRLDELRKNRPWYNYRTKVYNAPTRIHPISGQVIAGQKGPAKDNILTVMKDAAFAAVDPRLVLGRYVEDVKGSRVQTAAREMAAWYRKERGKKGVTLVFMDVGTPQSPSPLEFLGTVASSAEGLEEAGLDDVPFDEEADGPDVEDTAAAFNLYDALKQALIERGVPSREIAYVHQARNAAERLALFQAARAGEIRFVFASTDIGGVGMSIQERLGHMVEIDVPRHRRPGDVRQRFGRIIRQGNTYDTVRITRFVTKGTSDEWSYGLIAKKATGIDQFMRGEADTFSDEDPLNRSIEEAQILATGDPRGIDLIKLRNEAQRLESQAIAQKRSLARATGAQQEATAAIATYTERLQRFTEWMAKHWVSLKADRFVMTVDGTAITDRKAANTALLAHGPAVLQARNLQTPVVLGKLGPFPLTALYSEDSYGRGSVYYAFDAQSTDMGTIGVIVDKPPAGETFGEGSNVVQSLVSRYENISNKAADLQASLTHWTKELATAEQAIRQAGESDIVRRWQAAKQKAEALGATLAAESAAQAATRDEAAKAPKAVAALDSIEDAAKARIAERGTFRGGRVGAGIPVDDLADLVIIGAAKIAKGTIQFAQWSAEMVREFGEAVRPHLQTIFDQAKLRAAAFGPRPFYQDSGRAVPPAKPIPDARILEFPSIQKMPEAIRLDVQHLLEEFGGFEGQRRGVQSWARTEELAKDVWLPLETLKPGTTANAAELKQYQNAIAAALSARKPLLQKLADKTATDWDKAQVVYLTNVATVLTGSYRGLKAETGRAMNILKTQGRILDLRESKFLERMLEATGFNGDLAQIAADDLKAAGDPLKQLQLLRQRTRGTWFDYVQAYYYGNILSGIKTQERNTIGNSFNALANLVVPLGAIPADLYRVARHGGERSIYASELPHAIAGTFVGVDVGVRNAWFVFTQGFRRSAVTAAEETGKFDTPRFEMPGGLKNPWNIPGRGLEAMDEFFGGIAYHQELHAGAFAQARQEGLRDKASIADRMATLFAATDRNTRDGQIAEALIARAAQYKAHATFNEAPGEITKGFLWFKDQERSVPVRAASTILAPFMRITGAITRQGFEWSPAGFAMRGARSSDPRVQAQARGRAILGSLLMAPIIWAAAKGLLTGAPPDDEGEREEFYAQGKIGNAVKLVLPWGEYWVRYVLFQPYSIMLSAWANAWKAWEESAQDDAAAQHALLAGLAGAGRSLLDQSFLSGLESFQAALDDPRAAWRWGSLFVQGLVPLSGLARNITQAVDPYQRAPVGVRESVMAITPGLSSRVPVRRDRFGEPVVPRPGGALQRGFAVPEVSKAVEDRVTETLARLRVRPGRPNTSLTIRGETVRLTRPQQDALIEAVGREAKVALERTIAREQTEERRAFADVADEIQVERLQGARERASRSVRARATRAMLRGTPFTAEHLISDDVRAQQERDQRTLLRGLRERPVSRAVGQ